MTASDKPRAPRNSRPISAGAAFDRLCTLSDTRPARRQAALDEAGTTFDLGEQEREIKIAARVPLDQRERLLVMLKHGAEANK